MSIINDALRKARERRGKGEENQNSAQAQPEETLKPQPKETPRQPIERPKPKEQGPQRPSKVEDKKTPPTNTIASVLVIFTVIAVIIVSIVIFKKKQVVMPLSKSIQKIIAKEPSSEPPKTLNSKPTTKIRDMILATDSSGLTLTGIVRGEGEPMAVINDSVYMVGDKIKDASVVEITENAVVLERGGKKIELKVK